MLSATFQTQELLKSQVRDLKALLFPATLTAAFRQAAGLLPMLSDSQLAQGLRAVTLPRGGKIWALKIYNNQALCLKFLAM